MAACGLPVLARAALGRPPPRAEGFRQQPSSTLSSASEGACGGPASGSRGAPEGEPRHPASQELTAAERHIARLHHTACAVRPAPACPAASAPARAQPQTPEAAPGGGAGIVGLGPPAWGWIGVVRLLGGSCEKSGRTLA